MCDVRWYAAPVSILSHKKGAHLKGNKTILYLFYLFIFSVCKLGKNMLLSHSFKCTPYFPKN